MSDLRKGRVSRRDFFKYAGSAAGVVVLAGCAPAVQAPASGAAPAVAPAGPSGEITAVIRQVINIADAANNIGYATRVVAHTMFDAMVKRDLAGNFVSGLATSWENPDPLTWIFSLREGVSFHNGEEFTSESVAFTINRILDPESTTPALKPLLVDIDTVETPDAMTAVIRTKEPFGPMLNNLSMLMMLPPEYAQTDEYLEKPVGTGPFQLEEWVKGNKFVVEANPNYWQEGKPKLQRVSIVEVPEPATRLVALERGELDFVHGIQPEDMKRLDANPDVNLVRGPTYTFRQFLMNGGRPPFNDPLVRQAVYHAIDVDAMVNDIMGGTVERATSYINANVWGYAAQTPYPYDPDRAREILADAGLADGVEMELKWTPRDVKAKELVEFSIAQLEEVGIRGKSIEQEHTVWLEDLLALDWDVQLVSGATSTGDADYTLRRIYFSGNNRTGWVNAAYDDLVTQAARTTDLEERKELYAQAQKIAWDDGPNVMLFEDIATYGLNARVQGFEPWPDEPPRFADMWVSS